MRGLLIAFKIITISLIAQAYIVLMFRNLFPIFLLFCFSKGHAQRAAMSLDKVNVVYTGRDNPLTVVAEHYDSKDLVITTDNGRITGSNGHYEYTPEKTGRAVITVSAKIKTGISKLKELSYRVYKPFPPGIHFANRSGGSIRHAALCDQVTLTGYVEGFDWDPHIVIYKCKVIVVKNSETIFEKTFLDKHGVSFDEQTKKIFCALSTGAKILISEIELEFNGNTYTGTELSDLKFTVE